MMRTNTNASDLKKVTLGRLIDEGGSKSIYDIGDGRVVAVFNWVAREKWQRIVKEEAFAAKRVRQAGLKAQAYERLQVIIDDQPIWVLEMPSFSALLDQGIQVRDAKRERTKERVLYDEEGNYLSHKKVEANTGYGASMIFGTKENLVSSSHWQAIFKDITQDVILFLANGLDFYEDAFNLCIEDTPQTPKYDATKPALFTERNQSVRMFFYDFSMKEIPMSTDIPYDLVDVDGNILVDNIRSETKFFLERMLKVITSGATTTEIKSILGNVTFTGFFNTPMMKLRKLVKPVIEIIMPKIENEILYGVVVKLKAIEKNNSIELDLSNSEVLLNELLKTPEQWKLFFGHTLKMAGVTSLNLKNNNFNNLAAAQWNALLDGLRESNVIDLQVGHNNLSDDQINQLGAIIKSNLTHNTANRSLKSLSAQAFWKNNNVHLSKQEEHVTISYTKQNGETVKKQIDEEEVVNLLNIYGV